MPPPAIPKKEPSEAGGKAGPPAIPKKSERVLNPLGDPEAEPKPAAVPKRSASVPVIPKKAAGFVAVPQPGAAVEVFSRSQGGWLPGKVDTVDGKEANVMYLPPGTDPSQMMKKIVDWDDPEQVRPRERKKPTEGKAGPPSIPKKAATAPPAWGRGSARAYFGEQAGLSERLVQALVRPRFLMGPSERLELYARPPAPGRAWQRPASRRGLRALARRAARGRGG
jgi:hypothetical protein